MNNLYDVLETCLHEIEHGAEIETVLLRYPEYADELRPLLEASRGAKQISVPEPSDDVTRKNRAMILQRAAELRESSAATHVRIDWFAPLRRLATTLAVLFLLFASGTSLVGAATTSLPGENLYPVKRSWENLQLWFTFNTALRDALEVKHENERIEELRELITNGRAAEVTFSGLVTRQTATGWLVAGFPVVISPQTDLPAQTVQVSSAVRVKGSTQPDGSVLAKSIEVLPPGSSLPDIEDEDGPENDNESISDSGGETPISVSTQTPGVGEVKFDGNLDILNGDFWTINGVPSDISGAEIVGIPTVGAAVTVEGFFDENGVFVVTRIKFEEDKSSNDNGSNSNDDSSGNENNNNNDNSSDNNNDNSNENDNDDSNDNDDD